MLALSAMLFPMEMPGRDRDPAGTKMFFGHTGKFRLKQPLVSYRNNLKGVTLAVDNPNGRAFILRIKDGERTVVQSKYGDKVRSTKHTFYFPAIPGSKDKTYALEIIVPTDPGNRFDAGFFGSPMPEKGGTLLVNGIDSKNLLYYMPVYGLSAGEKLGLLHERMGMGKPSLFSATGITLLSLLFAVCSALFFGLLLRESGRGGFGEPLGAQNGRKVSKE
jgi:hypothetical protein